jgi:hypothetical protein
VSPEADTAVFIDGHVHVYGCYDAAQVFDGAWRHVQAVTAKTGFANDFQCVLIFTESQGDQVFTELAQAKNIGRWQIARTGDSSALTLRRDDNARLVVVAGRQLVSAERLEVSAYFLAQPFADGAPLDTLLTQVDRAGGLPVLPWGVGKWLGSRGRHVESRLMHSEVRLMVSDNGGRPWLWPTPRLFRTAEQQGIPVLAGTDPLPRVSEQQQAGRFGFVLKGPLSFETPAQDLKQRLLSLECSPAHYGTRAGALNFFRSQLFMQVRRVRNSRQQG